jgi:hypothetical protein
MAPTAPIFTIGKSVMVPLDLLNVKDVLLKDSEIEIDF